MMRFFQFLAYFDWTVLPRTIIQTFLNADWSTASKQGAGGLAGEAASSLLGTNTFPFFVPLESGWSPQDIQSLLGTKGIRLFGVGLANNELFFRVSKRQAAWAQYLMQRAGVPLKHRVLVEQPGESTAAGGATTAQPQQDRGAHGPASAFDRLMDDINSLF